ncbi:MAG: tRNA (adenosine(37)-N6)-threonylcarbamoyltransferase complex ATPase subunit type 1 TsaE [Ferruginibacter sp.]
MTRQFILQNISEVAAAFLEVAPRGVIAFHGDMGAGKTTFISALCRQLGIEDKVSSPTFAIINEYGGDVAAPVYHMDFYRVKNEKEARDAGVEEYFYSGHYCFVEWPEKAGNLLPENTLHCRIETIDDITRKLQIIL